MSETSPISHTVMRRVRRIHLMRKSTGPLSAVLLFMLALWGVGREVWVSKVLENMPSLADAPATLLFFVRAFQATDLAVQLYVILALGAFVWFTHALARMSAPRSLAF